MHLSSMNDTEKVSGACLAEVHFSVNISTMSFIIILQHCVLKPTFVLVASPSWDETVGEVETEFMGRVIRSTDRLDVVIEVEGKTEEHQCHIAVGCQLIVVLVQFNSTDVAGLGMTSTTR